MGPKISCVSQNNLGIREINVGDTHGRDWASKIRHLGLQTGNNEAQKSIPRQEFCMSQSPKIHREQAVCLIVKKDVDNQRVKCKELSDEKTKNTEKHNTVSMQKSEDIEGDEKEQQEKSSKYMSGQKKEKDKQWGLGTEEEKSSKEVKGSQTGENGRSFMFSDRESISGKSPSDTFPSAIVGVDGVEDRFNVKEKSKGTALP